jgi:hypothetical protein
VGVRNAFWERVSTAQVARMAEMACGSMKREVPDVYAGGIGPIDVVAGIECRIECRIEVDDLDRSQRPPLLHA